MIRCLLFGLLGLPIAGLPVCAQVSDAALDPKFPHAHVRRLPVAEVTPLPDADTWPSADHGQLGPHFEAPSADFVFDDPETPPKLWQSSFELGLDGTEGNSQTLNFRLGFDTKRSTPHDLLTLDLDYRKNTAGEEETAHRAFLDWRYERLFAESPWTCFVHGTVDYDELTMFDVRVTADIGLGYHLIKTESTLLAARVGGGFSHEIGSSDESYVPEAVFGLDFEHRLNQRQKLTLAVEHTPDITDFGDFRFTARAGWEVLIDQEMNLSLKLSALDRYDSTPDGAESNDLDYAAVLLWSF